MTRRRKTAGALLLRQLDGSAQSKSRLGMILDALAGRRTVAQVCRELNLGERRFHVLRHRVLQAALASLEPRPAGRPARSPSLETTQLAALQATIRELRLDLHAARVREEIALAMPQLLQRAKKGARQAGRLRPGEKSAAPSACNSSARPTRPRGHSGGGAD
jgi:hypothetical protein